MRYIYPFNGRTVLKPTHVNRVVCCDLRKKDDGKSMEKFADKLSKIEAKYQANLRQLNIFEDKQDMKDSFQFAEKIPYKFSYEFVTEDGITRTLMIEDWEVGALYRNCLRTDKSEEIGFRKLSGNLRTWQEKTFTCF